MPIETLFLTQGASGQADKVAQALAEFISGAQKSLHIAIYDFRLSDKLTVPVLDAIRDRAKAGVEVLIAYDHTKAPNDKPSPVVALGGDPAPAGTGQFLQSNLQGTAVKLKGISGLKLMHNKYIIRDVHTEAGTLWTGSINFTDDAWTLQENNGVRIPSPQLCNFFETDFQELWQKGDIDSTGINDIGRAYMGSTAIDVAFAPGEGDHLDHLIAGEISRARRRIKIASMLVASHSILGALDDVLRHNQVKEFNGIYDKTQMARTIEQWQDVPHNRGLAVTFEEISQHLVGKNSTPYTPTSQHDFMHNKVAVCDDTVITGSFNFSHSATMNAENHIAIHDPAIAEQYATYIDTLIARYR